MEFVFCFDSLVTAYRLMDTEFAMLHYGELLAPHAGSVALLNPWNMYDIHFMANLFTVMTTLSSTVAARV
jgi:hypothetical protein